MFNSFFNLTNSFNPPKICLFHFFSRQYLLNSLMHFVNGKIPRLILGCVHRIRCSKTKATLKASHNVCHSWIRAPRDQQSKWPKKSALFHFWKPSKSLKARRIHQAFSCFHTKKTGIEFNKWCDTFFFVLSMYFSSKIQATVVIQDKLSSS